MTTAAYIVIIVVWFVWLIVTLIDAWQDPWGRP